MPQPSSGWGGARPGAGRKPRLQVVGSSSTSSPGPTLGQALASLRQAAPQPGATSPSGTPVGNQPAAGAAAPPAGAPAVRPENESFAKLMGYVGTNVGILVIRDTLKKGGLDPQEPDDADIERTTEATAHAISMALGDAAIPWWGTLVASWGSLYLSMRIGAQPIKSASNDNAVSNDNASSAPTSPPAAGPTPVLGRGVPQPKRSSAFERLPEVEAPSQ